MAYSLKTNKFPKKGRPPKTFDNKFPDEMWIIPKIVQICIGSFEIATNKFEPLNLSLFFTILPRFLYGCTAFWFCSYRVFSVPSNERKQSLSRRNETHNSIRLYAQIERYYCVPSCSFADREVQLLMPMLTKNKQNSTVYKTTIFSLYLNHFNSIDSFFTNVFCFHLT